MNTTDEPTLALDPYVDERTQRSSRRGVLSKALTHVVRSSRSVLSRVIAIGLTDRPAEPLPREIDATRRLSVIVPIHDAPQVTDLCLRSLEAHGYEAEVILIDDGSTLDETVTIIDAAVERNPSFKLIRHPKAKGHSRSCEAGAELATREIICLLNSDAVVTSRSWAGVMEVFDSYPKAAIVGPATSSATTSQQIDSIHALRFNWSMGQIDHYARRYTTLFRWRLLRAAMGRAEYRADLVNGFAYFVRRAIWAELGGFPKELDDYGNETVLCRHAAQLGHHLMVTRRSYAHHFGKQSYGAENEAKVETMKQASLAMVRRLLAAGPKCETERATATQDETLNVHSH